PNFTTPSSPSPAASSAGDASRRPTHDRVTSSERRLGDTHRTEDIWPSLRLDYLTSEAFPEDDPDHGWATGKAVTEDGLHDNPWEPVRAENSADFNY
ncbi:hypothetical protein, partial [Streptomyces sp. NPDC056405]|uniref:hypothetical protein n=1 Tax=Streptomyces sp. NPDC056405 TaxID=3345811 RepID=UPI0035DF4C3C